jgi:hypothetical protein
MHSPRVFDSTSMDRSRGTFAQLINTCLRGVRTLGNCTVEDYQAHSLGGNSDNFETKVTLDILMLNI